MAGRRRLWAVAIALVVVVVVVAVTTVARHDDSATTASTTTVAPGTTTRSLDSSTTSATTTTTAAPASTVQVTVPLPDAVEAPNVVVGTAAGFVTVRGGVNEVEQRVAFADRAYRLDDATLLGQLKESGDTAASIWRFRLGAPGVRITKLDGYQLLGTAVAGGHDVAFLAPPVLALNGRRPAVAVYDVATGMMRLIGTAWGEGGSTRVSLGNGVLVVFGNDGQNAVTVDYYDFASGHRVAGWPALTHPSDAPGETTGTDRVVVSPDGRRIAMLDAPTSWSAAGPSAPETDLVVIDATDGHELLRTRLTGSPDLYTWLDFDGRWAVASRVAFTFSSPSSPPLPAVIVDTAAAHPSPFQLAGAPGTATLDR